MTINLDNVFFNDSTLKSVLNPEPKEYLEPHFKDVYTNWRTKGDSDSQEAFLKAISPIIDKNVGYVSGADKNYISIKAKILAMKSMKNYDPNQSSLATFLTRNLMPLQRISRQQSNLFQIPDRLMMSAMNLNSAELELEDKLGRMPTNDEVADFMGVSKKQIERLRNLGHERNSGAYTIDNGDGANMGTPEVENTIQNKHRHEYVLSALDNDPINKVIYEVDNQLNGRKKMPVAEMAKKLKLSTGAISQRRNRIAQISNQAEKAIYG